MSSTSLILALLRGGLVSFAVAMAYLAHVPWPALALLGMLAVCLVWPEWSGNALQNHAWRRAAHGAWAATLLLPAALWFGGERLTVLHDYYALLAWLVAGAMGLALGRVSASGSTRTWKILVVVWAGLGTLIWLGAAYAQNQPGDFYLGIGFAITLVVTSKRWFRLPTPAILAANTLLLFLVVTPIADLVLRPKELMDPNPGAAGKAYLYEVSKNDRAAHRLYWRKYLAQYDSMMKAIFVPDPLRVLPYRVRTNSRASFFSSQIRINPRGFRGKDLAPKKGRIYRIVALGESNTFGFTLNPEHKPWPEHLEEMIQQRLRPHRPVRVINAGLPHHSLEANLKRMQRDILPLQPDMIISYHGWNGFPWLNSTLPPVFVKHLPVYKSRPLRLLADCEYRLRLAFFKHSLTTGMLLEPPTPAELMTNRYAVAYRKLINVARTNSIQLVLANYSMAVNAESDPAVVEFYRGMFPSVYPSIQVNAFHSRLVELLAQQHPEIGFVDTHPQLDGAHAKFIDLVHFAPDGDRQLAETFFAAITNRLREDLESPLPPG